MDKRDFRESGVIVISAIVGALASRFLVFSPITLSTLFIDLVIIAVLLFYACFAMWQLDVSKRKRYKH